MKTYKNCIAYRSGIMPVHTIQVNGKRISVEHMNNLNKYALMHWYTYKLHFRLVYKAVDLCDNKYYVLSDKDGKNGIIALKDDTIRQRTREQIINTYYGRV